MRAGSPSLYGWKWMAGVGRSLEHVLHLRLLIVDREAVRQAGLGVVELERQLVQLESSIRSIPPHAVPQCLHFPWGHRLKVLRDADVLVQDIEFVDAGDRRRDRQTHR